MKTGDVLKRLRENRHKDRLDVLLIHCDLYYEMDYSNVSLGLLYVATQLEKSGFRVEVMGARDLFRTSPPAFRKLLFKKKPPIVGFYTISDNFELVLDTAGQVREKLPKSFIIAGGPLAASSPDEIMESGIFDALVTGEGEFAMEIIAKALIRNEGLITDAPGLIYREEGQLKTGKPVSVIADLDVLPFPDKKYFAGQKVFQVVSGRGCPFKCTFCFQGGHGLKFRFRSAKDVTEEIIDNLNAAPFVGFELIDDAFIMNPKRCMEIGDELISYREETRRDFIFFCQGRVNVLAEHPGIIPHLVEAGLAKMQLGIESGDEEVLKAYRKQITIDQIRNVVKQAHDTGSLMIVGGFILGGPFESEETFKKTVDLAVELIESAPGTFEVSAGFLGAYPGTEIAKDPGKFGLTMVEPNFKKGFSLSDVQFTTESFDRKGIRSLEARFNDAVFSAMRRALPKIPRSLLKLHYYRASRYGMFTNWHSLFLGGLRTVSDYFSLLSSPRFREFQSINDEELPFFRPMRVTEKRKYDDNERLILPPSVINYLIEDPVEKLIFELSSGKNRVIEIADRVREELLPDLSNDVIIGKIVSPFLKKLDNSYHVILFR